MLWIIEDSWFSWYHTLGVGDVIRAVIGWVRGAVTRLLGMRAERLAAKNYMLYLFLIGGALYLMGSYGVPIWKFIVAIIISICNKFLPIMRWFYNILCSLLNYMFRFTVFIIWIFWNFFSILMGIFLFSFCCIIRGFWYLLKCNGRILKYLIFRGIWLFCIFLWIPLWIIWKFYDYINNWVNFFLGWIWFFIINAYEVTMAVCFHCYYKSGLLVAWPIHFIEWVLFTCWRCVKIVLCLQLWILRMVWIIGCSIWRVFKWPWWKFKQFIFLLRRHNWLGYQYLARKIGQFKYFVEWYWQQFGKIFRLCALICSISGIIGLCYRYFILNLFFFWFIKLFYSVLICWYLITSNDLLLLLLKQCFNTPFVVVLFGLLLVGRIAYVCMLRWLHNYYKEVWYEWFEIIELFAEFTDEVDMLMESLNSYYMYLWECKRWLEAVGTTILEILIFIVIGSLLIMGIVSFSNSCLWILFAGLYYWPIIIFNCYLLRLVVNTFHFNSLILRSSVAIKSYYYFLGVILYHFRFLRFLYRRHKRWWFGYYYTIIFFLRNFFTSCYILFLYADLRFWRWFLGVRYISQLPFAIAWTIGVMKLDLRWSRRWAKMRKIIHRRLGSSLFYYLYFTMNFVAFHSRERGRFLFYKLYPGDWRLYKDTWNYRYNWWLINQRFYKYVINNYRRFLVKLMQRHLWVIRVVRKRGLYHIRRRPRNFKIRWSGVDWAGMSKEEG